jgi:predicted nuclease with TOPRIM domain
MTIFEYAIPFVFLVVATFVWLMRDNTQWKLMNDRLSLFTSNFKAQLDANNKQSKAADESNTALRSALMSQKNQLDNLEDHNHKLQQSLLLLEGKFRILQDKITGFKVVLPETVSISITKDVKDVARNRHKQRKAEVKKSDSKVFGKKPKAGSNFKRNVGVSSNSRSNF